MKEEGGRGLRRAVLICVNGTHKRIFGCHSEVLLIIVVLDRVLRRPVVTLGDARQKLTMTRKKEM